MNEITRDERVPGRRFLRYSVMFVFAFVFWLLIVWPIAPLDGRILWGDIAAGLVVAGVVALMLREVITQRFARLLEPARYFWAVVYLFIFAYYVIKANVDVAYRVLHPGMPIRPGIVRAHTRLRTASARTALANCITLTPGTLTIDIGNDGVFYVHWINVLTVDDDAVAREILGRFEWYIAKIFE